MRAVVATVLTTPGHEGCVYDLAGPDTLTSQEYADKLSAVLGRPITVVRKTIPTAHSRTKPRSLFSLALWADLLQTYIDDATLRARSTWMPPQAMEGWSNVWRFFKVRRHVSRSLGSLAHWALALQMNGYDATNGKYVSTTEQLLGRPATQLSAWLPTVAASFRA